MTRTHILLLMGLVVAVPAAAGSSFFAASPRAQPCFSAGAAAYRFSDSAGATYTIRIDNNAARPDLRLQLVDDPASADFVLLDDNASPDACRDGAVESIRVDPAAARADLTVALSKQASAEAHKIYVRSTNYTDADAAALFAVLWQNAHKATLARQSTAQR